ncbi:MAG: hypothetical protein AAFV19_11835 [Pseudomonadota bacterium]
MTPLTYLLGAVIIVAVCAYPLLWFWLESKRSARQRSGSTDGVSPSTGAERAGKRGYRAFFIGYGFVIGAAVLSSIWLDQMSPRWSYHEKLQPLLAACEQEDDAAVCLDLALKHRNGVVGLCSTVTGGTRFTASTNTTKSCTLLARDQGEADRFAKIACDLGSLDECFYAMNWGWAIEHTGVSDAQIADTQRLCDAGAFRACQFLTDVARGEQAEPVLPPMAVMYEACRAGNDSACLHTIRDRLLLAIGDDGVLTEAAELLQIKKDIVDLSMRRRLSEIEYEKLTEIDEAITAYFDANARNYTEGKRGYLIELGATMVSDLETIQLPAPSTAVGASGQ